ncbi:MAG: hypothetical protein KGH94_03850 [Candidatus Micrarchaeota archaeon]|nr:hypothetical protein [Candidatus Micrarchaeota archaeon]
MRTNSDEKMSTLAISERQETSTPAEKRDPAKGSVARPEPSGIRIRNGTDQNVVTIEGDLTLKSDTKYPKGASLTVNGNVVGNGHSLSVWGGLKVKGSVSLRNLKTGGFAEITGGLKAGKVDVYGIEAGSILAARLTAWKVTVYGSLDVETGSIGAAACETFRCGPSFKSDSGIVKNFSKYAPNEGAAKPADIIQLPRPRK